MKHNDEFYKIQNIANPDHCGGCQNEGVAGSDYEHFMKWCGTCRYGNTNYKPKEPDFTTNCSVCRCFTTPENGTIEGGVVTCTDCSIVDIDRLADYYAIQLNATVTFRQLNFGHIRDAYKAAYQQCLLDVQEAFKQEGIAYTQTFLQKLINKIK